MIRQVILMKKTVKVVVVLSVMLSFGWLDAHADDYGHRSELSAANPDEMRTVTDDPASKVVMDMVQPGKARFPHRDEGQGELAWSDLDENAISERLAMSVDGRWMAVAFSLNDERFEYRSAENGEIVFSYVVDNASGWISVSADGMIAAFAALDSVWMFRRDGEGVPFFRLRVEGYGAGPVMLTRDGRYLVATGNDIERETNHVWCFRDGEEDPIWTFEAGYEEMLGWLGATISIDGSVVALNGKYHLYILDVENGQLLWDEPTYNTESPIALSADGSILATGSLSGRLRIFSRNPEGDGYIELWHYSFTGANSTWISSVALSPDGTKVGAGTLDFYEDHYEGRLALFDTFGEGEPTWIAEPLADEVSSIKFSLDGSVVAVTTWGDIDNEMPDLMIHETHDPFPFYQLTTPGSLSGLAISDDGFTVVAGGKAVHNRVFGRGGRLYGISNSYPGAVVTGAVSDENGNPVTGAEIEAEDNPFIAISDENGEYRLRVEVEDADQIDITVRRHGYYHATIQDVNVERGEETPDIDFELRETDPAPVNLRASQGVRNVITLQWEPYNGLLLNPLPNDKYRSEAATGAAAQAAGLTPWSVDPTSPHRDNIDDAENINIYRSYLPGGPYVLIASVDGDESNYLDRTRIFPRHRYYYAVTADFGDGESDFSAEAAGWLDDEFLVWEADLEDMPQAPEIDGLVDEQEWEGSVFRDISDVYGYDQPDTAGSVTVRFGFDDETDLLFIGFSYHLLDELDDRMGAGIYIDDNGDGSWAYDRPGSEGNYWGYWVDNAPQMTYRSLSGPPYNGAPYYVFEDPQLAFTDERGYAEFEIAIPLGFHGPEEVALYAPEHTIGLGLFTMYRDDDENPVFSAWWPQDMFSIVSNPFQFAQVRIPADLIVPPQAPEEVVLDRDGDDLILTWSTPESGIDDGPLEDLAGIEIHRNGERLATVEPDCREYIDSDIIPLGWYEYTLKGFVLEDDSPFYGPESHTVGAYAREDPVIDMISYDDGSAESYFVVAFEGEDNRFAAKFTLDDFVDTIGVYWIDFLANSENPIDIYIARNDQGRPGEMIGSRYMTASSIRNEMHRFHYPDVRQPRIVIDPFALNDCWVVIEYMPESPGSPGIGVDRSQSRPDQNLYYTENGGWQAFNFGQLMVRIGVGIPPNSSPPETPPGIPDKFIVGQNYPNPFNSKTVIPLSLPSSSDIWLEIYNLGGRLLMNRYLGSHNAGVSIIPLDINTLDTGLYFLNIIGESEGRVIKIAILK